MTEQKAVVVVGEIERAIVLIRGQKVMLDRDLAALYGVSTSSLNKAVSRNLNRFPEDFMFQVTRAEFASLKFHFGTSSWGGTRKLPRAFTEQGVAMLSSVLRCRRAVQVNIEIMRAFVRLREALATHKALARKLAELERRVQVHDDEIEAIFEAIRQLMAPPETSRERIGFVVEEGRSAYAASSGGRRRRQWRTHVYERKA